MNPVEKPLAGKRILVTGAGSGIGRATALMFAAAGASVALLDRTEGDLDEVFTELPHGPGGYLRLAADVSDPAEMKEAFEALRACWTRLDVVVANAGINGVWAPIEKLKVEEWNRTLAVNLTGTFLTSQLSVPLLRVRGGSLVIVSSINGTRNFSVSGSTAYASSKAAQVAFMKMISLELAKDRIRVNAVCPGAVATHIDQSTERREIADLHLPVEFPGGEVPLKDGESGCAEDISEVIGFLASDASRHVTGAEIHVDGGQSLLRG